jgi:hypothetical protein
MISLKEALYIAELARINGPDYLSNQQLVDALVALAEDHENVSNELERIESVVWYEL